MITLTPNSGNIQSDMVDWAKKDQKGADKFMADLKRGDGNAMCYDLADAVKSGKLTRQEAADIGSQVQQAANQRDGGKINHKASDTLTNALDGQNVLAEGKTRFEFNWLKDNGFIKNNHDSSHALEGMLDGQTVLSYVADGKNRDEVKI